MNIFQNRTNVIAAIIVIIVLAAGFYINSQNKKTTTNSQPKVETKDDSKIATASTKMEKKVSANVLSFSPSNNASITTAPTEVSINFSKKIIGGSEIKVMSDKGVDVVPSANKISSDGMTLTVPIKIISKGVYSAGYSASFLDGTKDSGEFKFTLK